MLALWLASLFLTLKIAAYLPSKSLKKEAFISWLVIVGGGEIYAGYRLILRDRELCREINYVCPNCSEPLYPYCSKTLETPAKSLFRTGKCPMCQTALTDF
jgi:hypothetical protein